MSDRRDDAEDPPPPAGADADDAAWLLARTRGEVAPAPTPANAAAYAKLEGLLAELPPVAPPPDWKAAILARVDAAEPPAHRDELSARRARRWWLAAAPAVAVAAAVMLLLTLRKPGTALEPGIETAIAAGDGTVRGSGAPALHDRLTITARLADIGTFRVYRDDRVLVAQCPGDAACTQRPTGKLTTHTLTLTLDAPGRYHVVLLLGAPPPATGRYDVDFAAANTAGATIIEPRNPTFTVR